MQVIHRVVVGFQLAGLLQVPRADHPARLERQRHRDSTHLGEVGADLLGQYVLGVPAAHGLGDVQREVAHSFQVAGGVDRGEDDPQVGRHRGLQRQSGVGAVLGDRAQAVDSGVVSDDVLGELEIALEQRGRRLLHGRRDDRAHRGEVVAELAELFLEGFPHSQQTSCAGPPNGSFT